MIPILWVGLQPTNTIKDSLAYKPPQYKDDLKSLTMVQHHKRSLDTTTIVIKLQQLSREKFATTQQQNQHQTDKQTAVEQKPVLPMPNG
jgi:hypothetical protein